MGALNDLCKQITELEKQFHETSTTLIGPSIHDTEAFQLWRGRLLVELPKYKNGINDTVIDESITILQRHMNGTNDQKYFNQLKGNLLALNAENNSELKIEKVKVPKVFISHSSNDKEAVACIVDLLCDIGLDQRTLFCSSYPDYNIPLDEEIYDYLSKQFKEFDVHVIFVLSDEYYKSAASLNEMGATWILQKKYTSILLPGFEFAQIRGVISPSKIAISFDDDELPSRLKEFKNNIISEFHLDDMPEARWNRKCESFIQSVRDSVRNTKQHFDDRQVLILKNMKEDSNGNLLISYDLSGCTINSNSTCLFEHGTAKELVAWEESLKDLDKRGYIEYVNAKKNDFVLYRLTNKGYQQD